MRDRYAHHEVHTSNKRTLNSRSLFMKVHVIWCFVCVLPFFFRRNVQFSKRFLLENLFSCWPRKYEEALSRQNGIWHHPWRQWRRGNPWIWQGECLHQFSLWIHQICASTWLFPDFGLHLWWERSVLQLIMVETLEYVASEAFLSWIFAHLIKLNFNHTPSHHTLPYMPVWGVQKESKKPEVLASFCPSFGVRPSFLCYQEVVVWTPSMAESFNFQLSKNLRQKTWWNGMRFTCKNSNRCLMNTKENLALATENCIVSDRETRRNFCSQSYFALKPLETWTKKTKSVFAIVVQLK